MNWEQIMYKQEHIKITKWGELVGKTCKIVSVKGETKTLIGVIDGDTVHIVAEEDNAAFKQPEPWGRK